jgi:biotin carboxylase
VPEDLRRTLSGFAQVHSAMDAQSILNGVRQLQAKHGQVVRLLGALEHVQVQLAEVRAALGLPGMQPEVAKNFRDKARMKDCFAAAGVPCARHKEVLSPEDAWQFAKSRSATRW